MKKSSFIGGFVISSVLAIGALAAVPGQGNGTTTLTGYVADAKCAKAGKVTGADHAACAQKCIKSGESAVLVVDSKVYKVKDQESVLGHVGQQVTVTGKLHGDTIDVDTLTKP